MCRKSRVGGKRKHQYLKVPVKGDINRSIDRTKSRDRWRHKAEQADAQHSAAHAEIAALEARIVALEEKKPTLSPIS